MWSTTYVSNVNPIDRHFKPLYTFCLVVHHRLRLLTFRVMARTSLDEVLQVRHNFIEHQLAHAVRDPARPTTGLHNSPNDGKGCRPGLITWTV